MCGKQNRIAKGILALTLIWILNACVYQQAPLQPAPEEPLPPVEIKPETPVAVPDTPAEPSPETAVVAPKPPALEIPPPATIEPSFFFTQGALV